MDVSAVRKMWADTADKVVEETKKQWGTVAIAFLPGAFMEVFTRAWSNFMDFQSRWADVGYFITPMIYKSLVPEVFGPSVECLEDEDGNVVPCPIRIFDEDGENEFDDVCDIWSIQHIGLKAIAWDVESRLREFTGDITLRVMLESGKNKTAHHVNVFLSAHADGRARAYVRDSVYHALTVEFDYRYKTKKRASPESKLNAAPFVLHP